MHPDQPGGWSEGQPCDAIHALLRKYISHYSETYCAWIPGTLWSKQTVLALLASEWEPLFLQVELAVINCNGHMTLGVIQAPPTAGLPALAAAAEFIAKDCKIAFDANQISSRYSHTKTQVDSPASITDGWMFWVCSSVEARRDSQSVWS